MLHILFITGAILTLFLGIFVYASNTSKLTNLLWLLFCFSVFCWCLGLGMLLILSDSKYIQPVYTLHYVGAIFIPSCFLLFIKRYLNLAKYKDIILSFSCSILLLISYINGELVSIPSPKFGFNYYTNPGKYYALFIIFFFGFSIYTFYLMLKKYLNVEHKQNKQLLFLILSVGVGFAGGSTAFPLVYDLPFPPYGVVLYLFFLIIFTYAILRHKLMDIHVVIKRSTYFMMLFLLITLPLYFITNRISNYLDNYVSLKYSIAFGGILWAVIILMADNIYKYLIEVTDRIFFMGDYNYNEVLQNITRSLQTINDIERLVTEIDNKLTKILKINHSGFFLPNKTFTKYRYVTAKTIHDIYTKNFTKDFVKEIKPIDFNEKTLNFLSNLPKNCIQLHELKEYLKSSKKEETTIRNLLEGMQQIDAHMLVASISAQKVIGILALGEKRSGLTYTKRDINLLFHVVNQGSLVLSKIFEIEEKAMMRAEKELHESHKKELQTKNTQLSQALSDLKDAQKKLIEEEQMIAMGNLAGEVAHDIRNPLSSINRLISAVTGDNNLENMESVIVDLYKQIINFNENDKEYILKELKYLIAGNLEIKKTFKNITEINTTLRTIANDFLEYSKVSKDIPTNLIEIKKIVKGTLSLFEKECNEKNIEIISELSSNSKVLMFEYQIQRIISNIFDNAIKAVCEYEDSLKRIEIKLYNSKESGQVILEIRDYGYGIKDENLNDIFKPFYTKRKNLQGTGLGLAIVKKIIQNIKGKIEVESQIKKGTTFKIYFPSS